MVKFGIGELSAKSGISRRNIHFYVQRGLIRGAIGAGLAARYREDDLLRLRAIHTLRSSGMRLDEIRERLKRLDVHGLKQVLAERPGPIEIASREPAAGLAIDSRRAPVVTLPTTASATSPAPAARAQSVVRFTLSPGVELLVDAGTARILRPHVPALTRAVKQILGTGQDPES